MAAVRQGSRILLRITAPRQNGYIINLKLEFRRFFGFSLVANNDLVDVYYFCMSVSSSDTWVALSRSSSPGHNGTYLIHSLASFSDLFGQK